MAESLPTHFRDGYRSGGLNQRFLNGRNNFISDFHEEELPRDGTTVLILSHGFCVTI